MRSLSLLSFRVLGLLLLFGLTANGQVPVELHITHKLGASDFAFNTAQTNSLGNDFDVTRLQYYISKISITHDGGAVTEIPNHYILVDAASNLREPLGDFSITSVESVSFYVGVDTPTNHMDPSAQPAGHPLEPKAPSMHWGWTAGYIFVAMDGKSGTGLAQNYEVHALGDQHYQQTTVTLSGTMVDGKLVVALNANYVEALRGIDVSAGLMAHGDGINEGKLLSNFKNYVFSAGAPVLATNNVQAVKQQFKLSPNPSNGTFNINFPHTAAATVTVTDVCGRTVRVMEKKEGQNTLQLNLDNKGIYFVRADSKGYRTEVERLVIN